MVPSLGPGGGGERPSGCEKELGAQHKQGPLQQLSPEGLPPAVGKREEQSQPGGLKGGSRMEVPFLLATGPSAVFTETGAYEKAGVKN